MVGFPEKEFEKYIGNLPTKHCSTAYILSARWGFNYALELNENVWTKNAKLEIANVLLQQQVWKKEEELAALRRECGELAEEYASVLEGYLQPPFAFTLDAFKMLQKKSKILNKRLVEMSKQ